MCDKARPHPGPLPLGEGIFFDRCGEGRRRVILSHRGKQISLSSEERAGVRTDVLPQLNLSGLGRVKFTHPPDHRSICTRQGLARSPFSAPDH